MNKIQIFRNSEFGQVRTMLIDNEPWFVGMDIAQALGYKRPSDAIASHVHEGDKLKRCFTVSGQGRNLLVVNESGMYALIFGSKLENAIRFKNWVTSEVLPSIRKHGGYFSGQEINCIIVKDMSRFMRNYIEMGDYLENIFPFMGVRFIAINDGYDSSKESQNGTELDIQFKNLLNDYYSRDISEKMTTALYTARKQGKYTTGTPPYGYLKDPKNKYKLIIDEAVSDNVRYIFQLILEGYTLNETAKILNDEGVITARARRKQIKGYDSYSNRWFSTVEQTIWSHSMVRRILKNEVYTGTMVFNKTSKSKLDGGSVTYHPKEEWEKIYNNHEAIISKETFDRASELLKSRHKNKFYGGKSKYKNSPIAPFVRCNKCGYKIRFLKSSNEKELIGINLYCYYCRMLEQEEKLPHYKDLESDVFEILKDRFHTDKVEKQRLLKEQKKLYDKNDELSKKKRIEFENYKFGKISREYFIEIKDQLQESTEENNKRIEAIDKELKESGNIESLTENVVGKYIKTIYISGKGIEKIEYC